jgi:hypothetical protein
MIMKDITNSPEAEQAGLGAILVRPEFIYMLDLCWKGDPE